MINEIPINTSKLFNKQVDGIYKYVLKLEDNKYYEIPVRCDGYVCANKLCVASNKPYSNWKRLKETKLLLNKLQEKYPQIELIHTVHGGNSKLQGTYIHPDLAINLAQWCSPSFSLQVSKWIRELIITDEVKLAQEKTDEQINEHFQKQIEELNKQLQQKNQLLDEAHKYIKNTKTEVKMINDKYKKLYYNHQTILKRKELYRLKEGSCVYVINMRGINDNEVKRYKIGQSSDLTNRVCGYRTSSPFCKVLFVMYVKENIVIEKCMKIRYEEQLKPNNHEFISSVNLDSLIESIIKIADILNQPYELETDENLDKFNSHILPLEEIFKDPELEKLPDITHKRCGGYRHTTEEEKLLPISHFSKHRGNKDGYQRLCKECVCKSIYGDDRKRQKQVVKPDFDITTHKWCNRCENVRLRSNFHSSQDTKDGLNPNCKICKREQKQLYLKNKKSGITVSNSVESNIAETIPIL